jgi:hypothetical protein
MFSVRQEVNLCVPFMTILTSNSKLCMTLVPVIINETHDNYLLYYTILSSNMLGI